MRVTELFFWALTTLATAAVSACGNEVREAIESILAMHPCCSQAAAVWSPAKALRSAGFRDCEWVEEAGRMAEENLAVNADGDWGRAQTELPSGMAGSGEADVESLRELEKRLKEVQERLGQLAGLLGTAEECREEALRTVEALAMESPGKSFARMVCVAWVRLTLNSEHPERFSELGEWYLEKQGADSREFTWFCDALWRTYPAYRSQGNPIGQTMGRYLLSAAEKIREPYLASRFDQCASGRGFSHGQPMRRGEQIQWLPGVEGWEGSLQRRRLAERFADDAELRSRAAAELAADEKDLTDLREVYGAWEEDGEDAEPPDGEKE